MADQLVSADPQWAGAPASSNMAHISAPPEDRPVTLGDLREDPGKALARIGTILKKDASDPRLWLGLAASYFAPKIFNAAGPIVARGATAAMKTAGGAIDALDPDLVSIASPRAGAVLKKAQQVRDYMARPPAPAEPPVAAPATSPVAAAPASTAAPVPDTPPPPPVTASPVSPASVSPAPPSARPDSAGATLDLPLAQRTKGQQSPTWLQSDLGIAARRHGLKLSAPEYAAAESLMREHGVSANEAVQTVGQLQATRTPSGLTLSPEEASQVQALKQQGQSGAQAEAAILKLRALAKKLKTPSSTAVTDAVAKRNATGRWDE
jgi:hypothetical protein